MEETWRSRACVVGDHLIPILQCVVSGIVVILNVKRLGREIGRGKGWQKTVTTDRTRAGPKGGWRSRNRDYWREYRERNPAYTEGNRIRQRERNRRRRSGAGIAKMDELRGKSVIRSGRYRLVPLCNPGIAKMDELIVEIGVIARGCSMGVQGS